MKIEFCGRKSRRKQMYKPKKLLDLYQGKDIVFYL